MSDYGASGPSKPSGWAMGGVTFAACVLTIVGFFEVLGGLAAIINDEFFVVGKNYTFDLDTSAWGWIHLILGIVILGAGIGLFTGKTWAGITAIVLATLSALVNFLYIPYYPLWSILVIALNIWVIWAITTVGARE